jgi:hypothetical protein
MELHVILLVAMGVLTGVLVAGLFQTTTVMVKRRGVKR